MKCLLCKENEADETGSHILTHSLISNCINEQGKKGRNKEMMFGISQSGERKLFVGNQVLPDKIVEIKGRELSDQEVENNDNDLVVDNIYCKDCERLFGRIESEFSRKILGKIRRDKIYDFTNPDNILIRLYFYIQVWRASSFKYTEWSLPNCIEEPLREIILEGCTNYDIGISAELEDKIIKIPIIINYLDTPDEKSSSNLIFIPNETLPYLLFLCDFVVEFFTVQGVMPSLHSISNYNGLNDNLSEQFINLNENRFKLRCISDSNREKIINSFSLNEIGLIDLDRIKKSFVFEYLKSKKTFPTLNQFLRFMFEFSKWDKLPLLEQMSEQRISNLIKKIIKE
ncbi:hypothetical protein LUD75_13475 [Epilithonimonas sp. JDS]|uniref:hypothetical protein n=1 Tax=Epilithonimonas sp. JDS TaxID=2902797 RepID=UPI001E37353B|nr:hypothetical protein [Epilithonimonas sp. JDS]MCD9855728.1 hypothetical protein [Epilithonimonas sp. JDS]